MPRPIEAQCVECKVTASLTYARGKKAMVLATVPHYICRLCRSEANIQRSYTGLFRESFNIGVNWRKACSASGINTSAKFAVGLDDSLPEVQGYNRLCQAFQNLLASLSTYQKTIVAGQTVDRRTIGDTGEIIL